MAKKQTTQTQGSATSDALLIKPAGSGKSMPGKPTKPASSKQKGRGPLGPLYIYGFGFLLLAIFCGFIYGDVFHQIALQDFVCSDAEAMTFVRRMTYGNLYWAARYVLLIFKNQWLGGLFMAAVLTLSAWLFDRLIPASMSVLRGLGFLPAFVLLVYMVSRGYNLFLRCEISTFVIQFMALFLVSLIVGAVGYFLNRRKSNDASQSFTVSMIVGLGLPFILFCGLTSYALRYGENVRISCRMQNIMASPEPDWDAMSEAALSCRQPSRSVAALYVISLVQQNQLLDRVFDIPYNYPKLELDNIGGDDEGINYIADCNLYAGMPNAAYHTSMENHVMIGPRLNAYKRMAICAILNDEPELARRYLNLISKVPFEQEFIDFYTPYVGQPDQLTKNPVFAKILELYPREDKFEQNYRQPIFLGYNVGLLSGSDATLKTSVATCMYSKDLNNLLLRTNFLQQKVQTLPLTVQQSIAVASLNREGLLDKYPSCKANMALMSSLRSFVSDAKPFLDRQKQAANDDEKNEIRAEMAEALRENWLGSYYYYYYCGNIDQTVKKTESHGVN